MKLSSESKYNLFAVLPGQELYRQLDNNLLEVFMTDPHVQKLAEVLVRYSLNLQPGEEFALRTSPLAEELNLAIYKEALLAGAFISVVNSHPGVEEIFLKYAKDEQLDHVSPINRLIIENFRALLDIDAEHNTRELSGVDPSRLSRMRRARKELSQTYMTRMGSRDLKWCGTVYPTQAFAQEADMSLSEYQDFVYEAGKLNSPDPVGPATAPDHVAGESRSGDHPGQGRRSEVVDQRSFIRRCQRAAQFSGWRDLYQPGRAISEWLGAVCLPGDLFGAGSDRCRAQIRGWQDCQRESQQRPGTADRIAQYGSGVTLPRRAGGWHELRHPALHQEHAVR
jgi:hypothetical protein